MSGNSGDIARQFTIIAALFLFLSILLPISFSADPVFSPSVDRPGFSTPEQLSTNQSNVYLEFYTGAIDLTPGSGSATTTQIDISLSSIISATGTILSLPNPICPPGLSTPQIINNDTLRCVPRSGIGETGLSDGEAVTIALTINSIRASLGTNPHAAPITVTDSEGNSSTVNINFTLQNRPSLHSSVALGFPATVSKGQQDVPITFRTVNSAGSPASLAEIDSAQTQVRDFLGALSGYSSYSQSPAGASTLDSGEGVNFTFYIDIPLNASAGTLTQWFNLTVTDPNSQQTFTSGTVQDSTTVLNPPNLTTSLVINSTRFISRTYPYNTLNLTIRVNNSGQASANITGASLKFYDSSNIDVSSEFTYTNTSLLNATIPANTLSDIAFNVTGIGSWSGGPVNVNYTVSYVDGGSGVQYGPLSGNKSNAFGYDTAPPALSILGVKDTGASLSAYFIRPTSPSVQINSTVTDSLSGTSSNCIVLFGNNNTRTTTDLSYSSGTCNGSVIAPAGPSLYGELPLKVVATDAVGNNATAVYSVFLYTLLVDTFDGINGAEVKNSSTLSDAIVGARNNTPGNQFFRCYANTELNSTRHFCGIPYGTVVNVSAYSPAYVWNQSQGNQTVCVGGSENIFACDTTTPALGRVYSKVHLLPNTLVIVNDEFGLPVAGFNITVTDSSSWLVYLSDGGAGDENSSAGAFLFPFDTAKRNAPFSIEFNVAPNYNNTGLSSWSQAFTPTNTSQTVIQKTSKYSVLFNLLDEFGSIVNRTGGSIVYNPDSEFGFSPVACIANPSDNHVFGCKIPSVAKISNTSYGSLGAPFSVEKPGFVSFRTLRLLPPMTPASSQINSTERANFTIIVQGRDAYNYSSIDYSKISSVETQFAGACSRNGTMSVWGCPSTVSDAFVNITPTNASGFLYSNISISPSALVQKVYPSLNNYSIEVETFDELAQRLVSQNISSVAFNGTISCVQNPLNSSNWGCPVPITSANSTVLASASPSGHYINSYSQGISPPVSIYSAVPNRTTTYHNYTIRMNLTDEFSRTVSVAGANVTAHSGNITLPCLNSSLSDWFCPIKVSSQFTVRTKIPGYVSSNISSTAPAPSQNQSRIKSQNQFTIIVYTRDSLGGFPDIRGSGNVTFGGLQCVNNSVATFVWGCPIQWSSTGFATITNPGIISWNSSNYTSNGEDGPQVPIFGNFNYALLVNLTDEIGTALSGATVGATGLEFPCQFESPGKYHCPVSSPTSTVTASKTGYVNRTAVASGMSTAGPQIVLQLTRSNSSGLEYSASIRITREANDTGYLQEMSEGIEFINATSGAQIAPSGNRSDISSPNVFLFAFPAGTQNVIVRKAGYVDRLLSMGTTSAVQQNEVTEHKFSTRISLFTENGTQITAGAVLYPYSHHRNISATTNSYYFAIPSGYATIYAGKLGHVNNSTSATINTTYPNNQTQLSLILPTSLKLTALDWGGAPLNGTTITIVYSSNGTLVLERNLSSSENSAYFDLPKETPAVNVSVSKQGYNTAGFSFQTFSDSIQNSLVSSQAQGINLTITDWAGFPVSGATVRLYRNTSSPSEKIATCVTTSAGACSFTPYNGPANSETAFFNSSRLSQGDLIVVDATKPGFAGIQRTGPTYYYQNLTSPLPAGQFRISGKIVLFVRNSWNSGPVTNATITLSNLSASTIALGQTNSTGGIEFSPNYYASANSIDSQLSPQEISHLASIWPTASKAMYSNNTTILSFNSSKRSELTITLSDSEPPVFTFYWPDGSPYDGIASAPYHGNSVGFEQFNATFSVADPYGADGSGLAVNGTRYRILNSTGGIFLNWTLPSCSLGLCNFSILGTGIPTGNFTVFLNSTDNSGLSNVTNFTILSIPVATPTSIGFSKPSAFSHGLDYWNFSFDLFLKGDYAEMKLSDFSGIAGGYLNITEAGCPNGACARMWYYNSSCLPESAPVSNKYNSSFVPSPFCDTNLSTLHIKEAKVFLVVAVPPSVPSDRYTGTYGFSVGENG